MLGIFQGIKNKFLMKNIFKQQSQFELFPGASGVKPKKSKGPFFDRSFALSFENIITLSIAFIMAMIVAFSFGVEHGRRVVVNAPAQGGDGAVIDSYPAERDVVLSENPVKQNIDTQLIFEQKIPEIEEKLVVPEKKVDKTPTLEKIHTIQVASFKQKSLAELEAQNLMKRGYEAFSAKKGSYYIVCVGRFEEKSEAEPLQRALKSKYSDCYIRPL